jgi:hypothetical protein
MRRPNTVWLQQDIGSSLGTLGGKKVRLEGQANKRQANRSSTNAQHAGFRRTLFRVFSWAESEGLVAKNPLRGMKRPKRTPRGRALTEPEVRMSEAERTTRCKSFLERPAWGGWRDFPQ